MASNLFGVLFTVASIPLVILLLIIYYAKNKFNNARTKLFRIMMWTLLVGCFLELAKVLLINSEAHKILLEVVSRLDFTFKTIWWYVLELYTVISYQKETLDDLKSVIKYNKFTKGLTIYYAILIVLILVIPSLSTVNDIDINKIIYMPIKVLIISIFVIGIEFVEAIYYIVKTKNDIYFKDDRLVSYTISIAIVVYYIIQSSFPYISFPMIFFTVFYYLAYYLNENPDLKLLKETNNSKNSIEKSNQTKSYFLSNISYGIKNPIDLMVGLCDEINNSNVYNEEAAKRNVNEILKYGNELIGIINNVLDVSKLDTNEIVVTEFQYKTAELLENLISTAKEKIGAKPVKIIVNIDQNISSVLYGDSPKLYQALLNVINNAVKYTEVGRIVIEVASNKVDSFEHLTFKITDTGVGIKEEEQPKLFIRDSKVVDNENNLNEGLGLGLVITKQYIESMGGKVWFESTYRVGSSFYIDVNQKIIDSSPIGTLTGSQSNSALSAIDCSQYKALLVDDNMLNNKVAMRLLQKYKFQVECITDAEECIERIKNFEKFDIIFIDHVMNKIDGIELLHILRSLEDYDMPPLVALTANALVGMREMYIKEGFDDYLAKPINLHEFDKLINKYFNK